MLSASLNKTFISLSLSGCVIGFVCVFVFCICCAVVFVCVFVFLFLVFSYAMKVMLQELTSPSSSMGGLTRTNGGRKEHGGSQLNED